MRLDVFMASNGLASSRTEARRLIESGAVSVGTKTVIKPSFDVGETDGVTVERDPFAYVGRGAYKLEGALEHFCIELDGLVAIDVGASTGGFTECMLRRGAARVFALDAGHGQLAKKLAEDPRVVNIEGVNARALSPEITKNVVFDFAAMDVSFISQTLILPSLATVLRPGAGMVTLIKPQFEAGRENVGKNGIVRSQDARLAAVSRVVDGAEKAGFGCRGIIVSPIKGGDGNIEYLAFFRHGEKSTVGKEDISNVVKGREKSR